MVSALLFSFENGQFFTVKHEAHVVVVRQVIPDVVGHRVVWRSDEVIDLTAVLFKKSEGNQNVRRRV